MKLGLTGLIPNKGEFRVGQAHLGGIGTETGILTAGSLGGHAFARSGSSDLTVEISETSAGHDQGPSSVQQIQRGGRQDVAPAARPEPLGRAEQGARLLGLKAMIERLSARPALDGALALPCEGVSVLPPEALLGLGDLPQSVILLGARSGEIELSTHLAGLGVMVSLVTREGILPGLDRDLVAELLPRLRALNIALHEDVTPVRAEAEGRGVRVTLKGYVAERGLRAQKIVASAQQDLPPEAGGLHLTRLELGLAGVSLVQIGLGEARARALYGAMVRVTRLGLGAPLGSDKLGVAGGTMDKDGTGFGFAKIITRGHDVLGVGCVAPYGQAMGLMLPWVKPLSDAVLKGRMPRHLLRDMAELDQPALGAEGVAFALARKRLSEASQGRRRKGA